KRSHLGEIAAARTADRRKEARDWSGLLVDPMGAGSDYTVFYHHLGIPSLNLGFGGEDGGGVWHSIYDSFHWYTTFSDTAFVYGRALAQTVGLATMRLAPAGVRAFGFPPPACPPAWPPTSRPRRSCRRPCGTPSRSRTARWRRAPSSR